MLGLIKRFLYEHYWLPIIDDSVYYNPVNTVTYALLFAGITIYLIPWFFEKLEITFDRDLAVALTPYIFLGGLTRSLKDGGYIDTILLETPIIYILLISFALGMLSTSKKIEKRTGINYIYLTAGAAVAAILVELLIFNYNNIIGLIWFASIAGFCLIAIYVILRLLREEASLRMELTPIYAHFWDASSTYVVLNYGGAEKHVLADFFIRLMGPKGMFIMKGLVIFPAVLYINREFSGEERNYYLFLIALLGFALGTRNIVSLITG